MTRDSMRGKVAVVTGGSRGIGKGIARRLGEAGARIVLTALPDDALEEAAAEVRACGAEAHAVPTDVSSAANVEALFDETLRLLGPPDILVNCAGVPCLSHFLEVDEASFDRTFATNVKGTYLCARRAAREMAAAQRRGCIVNIASVGAARAHRTMSIYDATKGALVAMTRAMALDLAPFRIRVNAVSPGAIDVDASQRHDQRVQRAMPIPWGRLGLPEDVANLVAFLCSREADYVTGQVMSVDGGLSAQLLPPQHDFPFPESLRQELVGRAK